MTNISKVKNIIIFKKWRKKKNMFWKKFLQILLLILKSFNFRRESVYSNHAWNESKLRVHALIRLKVYMFPFITILAWTLKVANFTHSQLRRFIGAFKKNNKFDIFSGQNFNFDHGHKPSLGSGEFPCLTFIG